MDRSTRRHRLRSAVAAALGGGMLVGIAVVSAPAANAQSSPNAAMPGIHTGGTRTETGAQVEVGGGQAVIPRSGRNHHRGGGQRAISCTYSEIAGLGSLGPALGELVPASKAWRTCYDAATGQRVSGPIVVTIGAGSPARPVVTEALIDMALANIDINLPELRLSPDAITLPNFPTWFWTTDQAVEQASASAAGVTITVTARRTTTSFEINRARPDDNGGADVRSRDDGATFTCAGPGIPFDPKLPAAAQSSSCRHRFAAPTRELTVDVTATWHITWRATNGTTGDLGNVQRTATRPYRVQERQSTIRTR